MFQHEAILRAHGHKVISFAAADPRNRKTCDAIYFPSAPATADSRPGDALRTLYSPDARKAIARVLEEERIEIVHLHSYFKRLTPAILPEIAVRSIPIIQTLHEYRAVCPVSTLFREGAICHECAGGRYGRAIRHRCAGGSLVRSTWNAAEMYMSDALGHKRTIASWLTISDFQRDQLIAMGMDAARLRTVYHPIATAPPRKSLRRTHVAYVGRLEDYKGIGPLLDAAARLPSIQFVLAGAGQCETMVRERIAGGLHNVELRGMLAGDALRDVVAQAYCVVVPSLWPEPFGLTSIEALAQGTPVIASATGGLAETVRDKVDGYQVPPGDVDALAARIALLAGDPDRANAMGEAGRKRMETDFGMDRYYREIMDVYHETLTGEKRGER